MNILRSSVLALALALSLQVAKAQLFVISNFGNTATAGAGGWTYTSATSTISGTEGLGNTVFGTPVTSNIGLDRFIRLSGNATTAPAGSFTISLEDNTGLIATARFTWGEFSGGATLTKPLELTTPNAGFNFTNVTGWSLDSGGSSQAVNASFSQLAAVPEPTTWFLMSIGLCIVWVCQRRYGGPLKRTNSLALSCTSNRK